MNIPTVWPDNATESRMLWDADHAGTHRQIGWDCGYHVKSLLSRVRDLERELHETRYGRYPMEEGK